MTQSELNFDDPQIDGQCKRLLDWLVEKGAISNLEAITELGILNGKGRIFDLRRAGYDIETTWMTGVNRWGEPYRCARYVMNKKRGMTI